MKWKWRNDRRSERNLCNCVKKPEKKIQDFNGVWTRDIAIPVRCSFLSREHMNPQLTCSQRPWLHSSVGRASHRYREVTGSNPVEVLNFFFQASLRNCINCVHFFTFSPYFCVFKYARTVKQKVWNEAENRERDCGRDAYGRVRLARFACVRLLRHALPSFFTDFEEKTHCFAVYYLRGVPY